MRPEIEIVKKIMKKFIEEGIADDLTLLFQTTCHMHKKNENYGFDIKDITYENIESCDISKGYYLVQVSEEHEALLRILARELSMERRQPYLPSGHFSEVSISVRKEDCNSMEEYRDKYREELLIAADKAIEYYVKYLSPLFGTARTFCD